MHAKRSTHLIHHDFITLTVFGERFLTLTTKIKRKKKNLIIPLQHAHVLLKYFVETGCILRRGGAGKEQPALDCRAPREVL
jgi:hypothetical protein